MLVAGAITTWLAFASADGLVAEDYYKQGLGINRLLAREDTGRRLGVSADLEIEQGAVTVKMAGAAPEALFVHLAHATRAGHDVRLRLARLPDGAYGTPLPALPAGRWHAVIEDPRASWRIVKEVS